MNMTFDLLGHLGLGGVFIGTVIEALGIPFPGGIMLIIAGVLVNKGELGYFQALGMAVTGFNTGAFCAYFIGKKIGQPFLSRFRTVFKLSPEKMDKALSWLEKSSAAFIILGRFVPMFSNIVPYMAGISRLGTASFFVYNTIFAVSWSSLNIALGYYFSQSWPLITEISGKYLSYAATAVIIIYLLLGYAIKRKL